MFVLYLLYCFGAKTELLVELEFLFTHIFFGKDKKKNGNFKAFFGKTTDIF